MPTPSPVATTTDPRTKPATQTAGDGIVIDKNKAAEAYIKEAEGKYIVPSLIREKFPDLIKLIYETESMNQEEREYWMQIMPIMTEDQVVKFRDILVNEKEQLSKLDTDYEREMSKVAQKPVADINEEEMKKRIENIKKAETVGEKQEISREEELLSQIQNL